MIYFPIDEAGRDYDSTKSTFARRPPLTIIDLISDICNIFRAVGALTKVTHMGGSFSKSVLKSRFSDFSRPDIKKDIPSGPMKCCASWLVGRE